MKNDMWQLCVSVQVLLIAICSTTVWSYDGTEWSDLQLTFEDIAVVTLPWSHDQVRVLGSPLPFMISIDYRDASASSTCLSLSALLPQYLPFWMLCIEAFLGGGGGPGPSEISASCHHPGLCFRPSATCTIAEDLSFKPSLWSATPQHKASAAPRFAGTAVPSWPSLCFCHSWQRWMINL